MTLHRLSLVSVAFICVLTSGVLSGCANHQKMWNETGLPAFDRGDTAAAEGVAEKVLVDLQKSPVRGNWDYSRDDSSRWALELAMLELADGTPESSLELLRGTRDVIDARHIDTFAEYMGLDHWNSASQLVRGDAADKFRARDYEYLMVYVLLALNDRVSVHQDAVAYAAQIDLIQDRLDKFEPTEGFKPKQAYQRVALGSYLQGWIQADDRNRGAARTAFAKAAEYAPESQAVQQALAKVDSGDSFYPDGHGALHVVYLGGRGPKVGSSKKKLDESDPMAEIVVRLVREAFELARSGLAKRDYEVTDALIRQLTVAPIFVRYVDVQDAEVPRLQVSSTDLGISATGERLMDVNAIAAQQIEAERQMIVSRAVFRRLVKAYLASDTPRWIRVVLDVFSTYVEDADTRSWSALPAEVQVARLILPEGVHAVDIGGVSQQVRIAKHGETFAAVVQRSLGLPPMIVVEKSARVGDEEGPE